MVGRRVTDGTVNNARGVERSTSLDGSPATSPIVETIQKNATILIAVLALAACSGNFGTGGAAAHHSAAGPQARPPRRIAAGRPTLGVARLSVRAGPGRLRCRPSPASRARSFNAPSLTPTPTATPKGKPSTAKSKAKPKAKPTASPAPSPTPSPTPSPAPTTGSGDAASPAPAASGSASPTPAANITFQLAALPKDAPAMVNPDPKALATTALVALRMHADATIIIDGTAIAAFTLPKDQIGGRSYAIQLYQETTRKKHHDDKFVGTFSDSTLDGTTLRFVFTPPKLQIKKDEVWLFVLYSGETPRASAIPGGAPSAGAPPSSAVPSPTPSPTEEP